MRFGRLLALSAAMLLSGVSRLVPAGLGEVINLGGLGPDGLGTVRKKSKRGRKAHSVPSGRSRIYPYASEKASRRFKGWPDGPLNNREPITHQPRVIVGELGTIVGYAKIGGTTIDNRWGNGRHIRRLERLRSAW